MVNSGLRYTHNIRRVQRDMYYMFGVSKIDIELLTSLAILIIDTGKIQHAKETVMRKAMQPRRAAQFIASFHSLIDKGYIIQIKSKKGHAYKLDGSGLMILERYDLQLTELAEDYIIDKSINDVLTGINN